MAAPAEPGNRASNRRRSSSSTAKQHGPMLGPTTAATRRRPRQSSAAALPTMPASIPRQPACTVANAGPSSPSATITTGTQSA